MVQFCWQIKRIRIGNLSSVWVFNQYVQLTMEVYYLSPSIDHLKCLLFPTHFWLQMRVLWHEFSYMRTVFISKKVVLQIQVNHPNIQPWALDILCQSWSANSRLLACPTRTLFLLVDGRNRIIWFASLYFVFVISWSHSTFTKTNVVFF